MLRGNPPLVTGGLKNPDPTFIKAREWEALQGLEVHSVYMLHSGTNVQILTQLGEQAMLPAQFAGLLEGIAGNLKAWKVWATSEMPQDTGKASTLVPVRFLYYY